MGVKKLLRGEALENIGDERTRRGAISVEIGPEVDHDHLDHPLVDVRVHIERAVIPHLQVRDHL
jgi:hypothetical protein